MSFGPPPSQYTASALEAERRTRRRRGLVLGVVALVLALVTVTVWTLSSGDDPTTDARPAVAKQEPDAVRETVEDSPKTPDATAAVYYTKEIRTVGVGVPTKGTWATDKILAKGYGNHVEGIRIGDFDDQGFSRRAWRLTFPAVPCAVTRHVSVDGRTAVVHPGESPGKNADATDLMTLPCDRLTVFDIDSGKKLWTKKLPGDGSSMNVNVTMTDGAAVVAWGQGSAAYDMTSGKRLWADLTPSTCTDLGFAGGRRLVALVTCGDSAAPTYRVQELNPRSGKPRWTYKVAQGIQEVFMVSSSPAVIAVAAGDLDVTDLIALSDQGRARSTIRLEPENQVECDGTFNATVEACEGIVVGRKQAYIALEGEIVAYDLETGQTSFKFDSPKDRTTYPLRMSGDKVIAYREASSFGPDSIVSLDPATRRQEALLYFSGDAEIGELATPQSTDILYEHGRAFFAARSLIGPENKGKVGEFDVLAVGVQSVG